MTKVLIATDKPFAKEAVEGMKALFAQPGYEVVLLEKYTEKSDLLTAVADVDAMVIRSDIVDADIVAAANNLKIVVRAGAGYDNIDLAACSAKNIVAMNTPGQNAQAVAELVLGMMVYKARNFFNGSSGKELHGKTLGLHAFGNVAKAVAKIAQGFGMQVAAFDPFTPAEAMTALGVRPATSVEDLYKTCQYISLHMPATAETKGSINASLLGLMPAGATLINTARKEVINEDDLLSIFAQRADFAYLSDIEPACKAAIEADYPGRFFFTPNKMGAQTAEANSNAGLAAAKQIIGFIENGDTTFQVNK